MGCETDSGWHLDMLGLDRGQTNDMDVPMLVMLVTEKKKLVVHVHDFYAIVEVRFPSKVRN